MRAELRLKNGITSLADEAAAEGNDWRDTAAQKAVEADEYRRLGIPIPFEVQPDDDGDDEPPASNDDGSAF